MKKEYTKEELEKQLSHLRYATFANVLYYIRTQQGIADLNTNVGDLIETVMPQGGHGYVCAEYTMKDGMKGYIGDDTHAIYLLDWAEVNNKLVERTK